jgi:hypothetical protein
MNHKCINPACAHALARVVKFCPYCGTPQQGGVARPGTPAPPPVTTAAPPSPPVQAPEEATVHPAAFTPPPRSTAAAAGGATGISAQLCTGQRHACGAAAARAAALDLVGSRPCRAVAGLDRGASGHV